MNQSEIENEFRRIFLQRVGEIPVDLAAARTECPAWDSFRHAELLISLQDELSLRFTTAEIIGAESFTDLLKIVLDKKADRVHEGFMARAS